MTKIMDGLFPKELLEEIREKFAYLDEDPDLGKRLFFENSGGSLRLKDSIEIKHAIDLIPDCTERTHERAKMFQKIIDKGTEDVLEVILGAKKGNGSLMSELSASQTIFSGVSAIMENVKGTNAVTTNIEHPSSYDAVKFYCNKLGLEFRVAEANIKTGYVEPETVVELVDENTVLVSVMAASNISGNIMDMKRISEKVREKNSNVYVVCDAVQHVPHGIMEAEEWQLDFVNFAPYKFLATRGVGFAYLSERMAKLPHHKLLQKDVKVWELGTPATALYASMTAVVDYVCWIGNHFIQSENRRALYCEGMKRIKLHERALRYLLIKGTEKVQGIREMKGVEVYLDNEDWDTKDLILPINFIGKNLTQCVKEYAKRGVTVYERVNTSIYSKRIVEALGFPGAVRVSPLHCHTVEEVEEFLRITEEIADLDKV